MHAVRRILNVIKHTSIGLFYLTTIFTIFNASLPFTLGVVLGGLLVTINFHLMCRSVEKALTPPHIMPMQPALVKHFVRFTVSSVIIIAAIISGLVHPLGLIIGLSVIVASFMLAAFVETIRLFR